MINQTMATRGVEEYERVGSETQGRMAGVHTELVGLAPVDGHWNL
jgi:hypothetical protein